MRDGRRKREPSLVYGNQTGEIPIETTSRARNSQGKCGNQTRVGSHPNRKALKEWPEALASICFDSECVNRKIKQPSKPSRNEPDCDSNSTPLFCQVTLPQAMDLTPNLPMSIRQPNRDYYFSSTTTRIKTFSVPRMDALASTISDHWS